MAYKKRIADAILEEKLESFGAVLITGPKGCGKTTTAKQKAARIPIRYLNGRLLTFIFLKPPNHCTA